MGNVRALHWKIWIAIQCLARRCVCVILAQAHSVAGWHVFIMHLKRIKTVVSNGFCLGKGESYCCRTVHNEGLLSWRQWRQSAILKGREAEKWKEFVACKPVGFTSSPLTPAIRLQ